MTGRLVSRTPSLTGSITALNGAVVAVAGTEYKRCSIQVAGTFVGTLTVQASNDGVNWVTLGGKAAADGSAASTLTAPGLLYLDNYAANVRVTATAWTSGTAAVTIVQGK